MNKIKQVVAAAALFGCMCGIAGTVTVEGKGSVTRHPDGMQLKFTVDALDKDMAKSKTTLAEKRAKIKEVLVGVGVSEDELLDSNIQMYPEYHREDREGNDLSDYAGRGKRVFDGYRHAMKCEFKSKLDLERLEKIYAAVVRTKCVEDLQIDFYLMDPKPAKAEARRLAVVNARTVADELCKAASATLGGVAEINYNARNYGSDACCASINAEELAPQEGDAPLFPSINVVDIEVSDEVVVKWEIKQCDNAVAVLNEDGERIGYLPRGHNEDVARLMDQGLGFRVGVMDVGALNHRCPSMTIVLILREPVPAGNGLIEIVD